jgi:MoaA/NifB/PqqE/SkfB family radical SAM enzyme
VIVIWRVTTACNLSCGFCAYAKDLPFARSSVEPEVVRGFARVLAEYRRASDERVLLSWLGGEPLLWAPWRELSAELKAFDLQVSATTNGSTLGSPSVRAFVVENLAELTVSVDGIGAVHDRLRDSPGGFDRLERDVRALIRERVLAGRGPRIRVNTVLMADNVEQFAALCERLATWGVDEISFNQLGGNDRPEFHATHRLHLTDVERFAAELPHARESLAARGVRLLGGDRYLERLRATASGRSIRVAECQPAEPLSGEQTLFITEAGIVAPCSFTTADYGVPVSEIDSVAALRALPAGVRAKRAAQRSRWCDDCPSTQLFDKFAA